MNIPSYTLERVNKRTGFTERVNYLGSLKNKPTGWRVVCRND